MTCFEKWQLYIDITQTVILFGTLLVAIYIGLKQTQISKKQTEISKGLLDIPFVISPEITYEASSKHINICNKGQTNLYLWGSKYGSNKKSLESDPRLIAPDGFYYLAAEVIEKNALSKFPDGGELREIFELYVANQIGTKFVITTIILIKVSSGICEIHTQTISIRPYDWDQ